MRRKLDAPRLTRHFGLISKQPDDTLVLSQSLTKLERLLPALAKSADDDSIFPNFRGIKPMEIKTARAYLTRFGENVGAPLPLQAGPKALLLDECFSLTLLPYISRSFGVSSHVEAEGLSMRNPAGPAHSLRKSVDSCIADFAHSHGFGGILTRDTDFINMARRPGHAAGEIHIFLIRDHLNNDAMIERLEDKKLLITEALASDAPQLHFL